MSAFFLVLVLVLVAMAVLVLVLALMRMLVLMLMRLDLVSVILIVLMRVTVTMPVLLMRVRRALVNAEFHALDPLPLLPLEVHVEVADVDLRELPLERGGFHTEVAQGADGHVAADAGKTVEKEDLHNREVESLADAAVRREKNARGFRGSQQTATSAQRPQAAAVQGGSRPGFSLYANTSISGFPLLPTVNGRPLGEIAGCSSGRPAAQPIVAWKSPTLTSFSATSAPFGSLAP